MYEDIIEVTGKETGPTSIILAGVHGDEKCGVEALNKVLPSLEIEKGRLLIAYGNPRAIQQNVRFIDSNLNRLFRSDEVLSKNETTGYEYTRAQFLKKYLNQADALLDIHASSIPKSKRFVICEKNAGEIVKYLPVDLVVSGFDNVEPGGTDYYMNNNGKVGICLECGYMKDPQSIQVAEESIFSFLKSRGHISNDIVPQRQCYVLMFKKYVAQTNSFVLSKMFENFEPVRADQVIGLDGQNEIKAPQESLILFAHNGKKIGDEVFLLGVEKESLV